MGRNRCRNSRSLSPEGRAATTPSQRVTDDVCPLRISNQDNLLGWTCGDLARELGLERGGSGRRRTGVVGKSGWVVDDGSGDSLGTVAYNGIN